MTEEENIRDMYRIETAKGCSPSGTLVEVWGWQEEYQGAFATLVLPDGHGIDVQDCGSLDDVRRAIREDA